MDKIPNGPDMISELFGKRERLAHQTRTALAKGIVEPFNIRRFAGFLADRSVTFGGKDAAINLVEIGETDRTLAILRW